MGMTFDGRRGRQASCAWCGTVYKFGMRECSRYEAKFCSDGCAERNTEYERGKAEYIASRLEAAKADIDDLTRAQMALARRPRLVWCNKCVVRVLFNPGLDSSDHECGYRLSIYGPFDPQPSWSSSRLLKPNTTSLTLALAARTRS